MVLGFSSSQNWTFQHVFIVKVLFQTWSNICSLQTWVLPYQKWANYLPFQYSFQQPVHLVSGHSLIWRGSIFTHAVCESGEAQLSLMTWKEYCLTLRKQCNFCDSVIFSLKSIITWNWSTGAIRMVISVLTNHFLSLHLFPLSFFSFIHFLLKSTELYMLNCRIFKTSLYLAIWPMLLRTSYSARERCIFP
jgi:hypothetical protein